MKIAVIMDYELVYILVRSDCLKTVMIDLFLTAPITCRRVIGEQRIQCYDFLFQCKIIYIFINGLRVSSFSANFHFLDDLCL